MSVPKVSTPIMSVPKVSTHIMSTAPKCPFPYCLLCKVLVASYKVSCVNILNNFIYFHQGFSFYFSFFFVKKNIFATCKL